LQDPEIGFLLREYVYFGSISNSSKLHWPAMWMPCFTTLSNFTAVEMCSRPDGLFSEVQGLNRRTWNWKY
jgi:hypothetical protein